MSKLVAHLGKAKLGNLNGMQAHNDRRYNKHSNKDIDVSRSCNNYDLVEAQGSYKARFDEQMRKYYKSPRKPRSDATVCDEWIFGSDADFFEGKSIEEQRRYFESIKDFMTDRYGNHVIYATVHVDEKTPHMHLGMVPLTSDGRLSHKAIFNKTELTKVHRDLHKHLVQQGFDLEAPDKSTREHLSVAEFKLQKSNELIAKNEEILKSQKERNERYINDAKKEINDFTDRNKQELRRMTLSVQSREQAVTERETRAVAHEQSLQEREEQADAREQQLDARSQQLDAHEQELQSREEQVELRASKIASEQSKLKGMYESLKSTQSSQNAREARLNEREADLSKIATDKGDALRAMLYRDYLKQRGLVGEADVYVLNKYDDMSKFFEPQQQQQSNSYGYDWEL